MINIHSHFGYCTAWRITKKNYKRKQAFALVVMAYLFDEEMEPDRKVPQLNNPSKQKLLPVLAVSISFYILCLKLPGP